MKNCDPIDLISQNYVFHIKDDRVITGILIAIDDQSNLLVTNATESFDDSHHRELGLVSIKRDTIEKVFMTEKDYKRNFTNANEQQDQQISTNQTRVII